MSKYLFTTTQIPGVTVIEPTEFTDDRGYFFESWSKKAFEIAGIEQNFIQVNQSSSKRGVLRGLHFQREPYAQAKLVRVPKGKVFDVAVDLRKGSASYGRWIGVILSGQNKRQLFIPKGCAHGFLSMEDESLFLYHCSDAYHPEAESGIRYDDPQLAIRWPEKALNVSEKDLALPLLKDANTSAMFSEYLSF